MRIELGQEIMMVGSCITGVASITGVLLVYYWCITGVLLVYYWCITGVLLVHYWCITGMACENRSAPHKAPIKCTANAERDMVRSTHGNNWTLGPSVAMLAPWSLV